VLHTITRAHWYYMIRYTHVAYIGDMLSTLCVAPRNVSRIHSRVVCAGIVIPGFDVVVCVGVVACAVDMVVVDVVGVYVGIYVVGFVFALFLFFCFFVMLLVYMLYLLLAPSLPVSSVSLLLLVLLLVLLLLRLMVSLLLLLLPL